MQEKTDEERRITAISAIESAAVSTGLRLVSLLIFIAGTAVEVAAQDTISIILFIITVVIFAVLFTCSFTKLFRLIAQHIV